MSEENKNDAAGNAADASPAESKETGAAQNPTGDAGTASGYRPEGLPDHLYGKTERETIDNIHKAYKGSRDELAKIGKAVVPEKFEDYKLELPEDVAKVILRPGKDGKDPLWEGMKAVFHENGTSAEKAVNIVAGLMKLQSEANANAAESVPAVDYDYGELGGPEKAKPIVDAVTANINGLVATGKLTEAQAYEFLAMTSYTEGLTGLKALLSMSAEKPIPNNGGGGGQGTITEESLNARVADPRYKSGTKKFDQAFYDETVKMFEEFYATSEVA